MLSNERAGMNLTCTNQLKKNETILWLTAVPKWPSWRPFPITPKIAAQKLTRAKHCWRFRSLRTLNDTPILWGVRNGTQLVRRMGNTYVKITNPQVIIDIPEQRPVTSRNAIWSSCKTDLRVIMVGRRGTGVFALYWSFYSAACSSWTLAVSAIWNSRGIF